MPRAETGPSRPAPGNGRDVTAVLGPTNTGKTHLAIERMLGLPTGMIGLPLRLLAREVYGRVVEKVGREAVALVTGEEKIKPRSPRYWVSTVEAMPRDVPAAFVAIDEIQLIADADRGHVFTEALLNRRGTIETMLLGSSAAEPVIRALLPGVALVTRPRLSTLTFAGERKLTRMPGRSAIIAFSAEEVYAIAELVRRQKGGAAVVLGALSPRTRNAQVAMFQAGEVDHLVATDAIGMGLNLEIDHVAFASDRKFDGNRHRRLMPGEFGQIAGRAGRAMRDGSFGTTGRCPPFDEELVEALEAHAFDPLPFAQWRNDRLDFSSAEALEASLGRAPPHPLLMRSRRADDETTLEIALARPAIRDLARASGGLRRLWDLCQLPDYRKISPHTHADLALGLFEAIERKGAIDTDFFAREVASCDRIEGDLDALGWRLAQVRTWRYCANRADWLADPTHWQNATRAVEDRLSDALHARLMQRFVDRRTSVLLRRLKEKAILETDVTPTGEVRVEGQSVGRLEGFRFTADPGAEASEAKTLRAAAAQALAGEFEMRANRLSGAKDEQFTLALDGIIRFIGEPVASLAPGAKVTEPRLVLLADEALSGLHREMVETRLNTWLTAHIAKLLGPLAALESGEGLSGMARGLAFQVAEGLGILDRAGVSGDVRGLDQNARGDLRKLGVRFGAHHLFLPALMKPGPRSLAAQLHALIRGGEPGALRDVSHLAFSGRTSIPVDPAIDAELYRVAGYRVTGPRALRIDILERLADLIRPAIAYRPGISDGAPPEGAADGDGFVVTGSMTSLVGCAGEDFSAVLRALGYRSETRDGPAITVELKVPAATVAAVPTAPVERPEADESRSETGAEEAEGASSGPAEEAAPEADASAVLPADPVLAEPPGEAAEVSEMTPVAAPVSEIWRVARAERPPRDRSRGRPAPRAAQPVEADAGARRENRPPRDRFEKFRSGPKEGAPANAGREGGRDSRRPGGGGPGRDESGAPFRKGPRPEKRHAGPPTAERRPPPDKAPDPDSPFAKLAALKAQLEGKG